MVQQIIHALWIKFSWQFFPFNRGQWTCKKIQGDKNLLQKTRKVVKVDVHHSYRYISVYRFLSFKSYFLACIFITYTFSFFFFENRNVLLSCHKYFGILFKYCMLIQQSLHRNYQCFDYCSYRGTCLFFRTFALFGWWFKIYMGLIPFSDNDCFVLSVTKRLIMPRQRFSTSLCLFASTFCSCKIAWIFFYFLVDNLNKYIVTNDYYPARLGKLGDWSVFRRGGIFRDIWSQTLSLMVCCLSPLVG